MTSVDIRKYFTPLAALPYSLALHLFLLFQVAFYSQWTSAEPIQIGGFFSTGITDADTDNTVLNNYQIENKTNYLADTVFGLQLDTKISVNTRFSAQLVAKDKDNSFDVEAEWLFVSHRLSNNVDIRAGRLRLPIYLISETILVGQSYDWVRPPFEVYSISAGLNQYNGFSTLYKHNFESSLLEFEFMTGQIKGELNILSVTASINSKELYGSQISYKSDRLTIRASTLDIRILVSLPALDIERDSSISMSNIGIHYVEDVWGLISEYSHLKGSQPNTYNSGYYISLYGYIDQWMPIITYGANNIRTSLATAMYRADSVTLGFRYNVSEALSYKAQVTNGEIFDGAGLLILPPLPGFDDKVTIYSMSLNLIF